MGCNSGRRTTSDLTQPSSYSEDIHDLPSLVGDFAPAVSLSTASEPHAAKFGLHNPLARRTAPGRTLVSTPGSTSQKYSRVRRSSASSSLPILPTTISENMSRASLDLDVAVRATLSTPSNAFSALQIRQLQLKCADMDASLAER
jgi:hypothetical protein